jgi:hypothetical protein
MKYKNLFPVSGLIIIFSLLLFSFCELKKKTPVAPGINTISDTSITGCDPKLWKYVYNPDRLEVINKCMTVTGVIKETNADDDGDQHLLLKLDAGQENLLKPKNMKKKNGWLVIEAVCINNESKKKVGDVCNGYVNHVQLPNVGDHVKVTGSYVIDSHNGWAEIHPITKVELVR